MDDFTQTAQSIASQIFLVPQSWFESPIFIINLVIPLITMGIFYYMMLKRLRIFRNNAVNLALGYCFAFISIPFFIALNPYVAIFVSVFAIVTLMGSRITLFRLLFAFIAAVAALAIASYGAYVISLFAV
jgi:hypothetical protein